MVGDNASGSSPTELERYYRMNQRHLQLSFTAGLAALIVGLAVLIGGAVAAYKGDNSAVGATVTIGGILTEFIGAGFFFLYSRNLRQSNVFYEKLIRVQDTVNAVELVRELPDERRWPAMEFAINLLLTRNEPKVSTQITPELIKAMADAKPLYGGGH